MNFPVTDIEAVVQVVVHRNMELSSRNVFLEKENTELRALLACSNQPIKDSHNSSIPSSQENLGAQAVRRTRSLRVKSNRSTGGQLGHKGSTLQMRDTADVTIVHALDYCVNCGTSLSEIEGTVRETRQSVDIPLPICPIVTNHVSVEKRCACGVCNRGTFPSYVKPGVSYGVNIHTLVAYLSTAQYIPFKRLTVVLKDLYGIKLSQGSVSNILNRMRKQSKLNYESIRKEIESSPVVGADETGEKLNGSLHWMWIFQNNVATYIFQDPSRGKTAIDKYFPQGLPNSYLVTDRHSSYFNMDVKDHQLCLAHLLRELIYLGELDTGQSWSSSFLSLLRESIHKRKTVSLQDIDLSNIKEQLNQLLIKDVSHLDKKFRTLQKSLTKHKNHLFLFLEDEAIPYDNNASERGIRPLKVKQKISGMFKSDQGANAFCQLHSIIDTARKKGEDPFLTLMTIAKKC